MYQYENDWALISATKFLKASGIDMTLECVNRWTASSTFYASYNPVTEGVGKLFSLMRVMSNYVFLGRKETAPGNKIGIAVTIPGELIDVSCAVAFNDREALDELRDIASFQLEPYGWSFYG